MLVQEKVDNRKKFCFFLLEATTEDDKFPHTQLSNQFLNQNAMIVQYPQGVAAAIESGGDWPSHHCSEPNDPCA